MERPPLIRQNMLKHSTETIQATKTQRYITVLEIASKFKFVFGMQRKEKKKNLLELFKFFRTFKVMIQYHLQ